MNRVLVFAAAFLALALPRPAMAYWDYGHETVAAIAWRNVTPHTRHAIRRLLADQKLLGTLTCPAGDIEQASSWADCIKKIGPEFKYAFNWHFQDVALCKPFDLDSPCKDGNCISAQIERDMRLLRDRATPRAERVKALVFLIHFLGDLHQPLHDADNGDQGGNLIPASWYGYTAPHFGLHQVWDGPLAERAATTGGSVVRRYSARERRRLAAGNVPSWSRQGWDLARVAYAAIKQGDPCGPTPALAVFDAPVVDPLIPLARRQLQRGGLRLARLLDRAFASGQTPSASATRHRS